MNNSAAIFRMSELPAAARSKNPKKMGRDDLHPSQRSQANGKDVVAILDGDNTHILAPTGHFSSAVKVVSEERTAQGI